MKFILSINIKKNSPYDLFLTLKNCGVTHANKKYAKEEKQPSKQEFSQLILPFYF